MRNSWNFFSPQNHPKKSFNSCFFFFFCLFPLHPAIYCLLNLQPSVIFLLCQNVVLNLGVFISSATKDFVGRIKFCCCCSVLQQCLTLGDPTNCSTAGFSVLHHLLQFMQTHAHCVDDAIQLSHPLSPPSNCNQNLMP